MKNKSLPEGNRNHTDDKNIIGLIYKLQCFMYTEPE